MKILPKSPAEKRRMLIRLSCFLGTLTISIAFFWIICVNMPGSSWKGSFNSLTEEEQLLKEQLTSHVYELAGTIGERNHAVPSNLRKAETYIETTFSKLGFKPEIQEFSVNNQTFKNISIEIKGREKPDEYIIIGAHYDTAYGCPGADDNATAVSALFETARFFRNESLVRSVRLVAFANEEPPFFHTEGMGSYQYAKICKEENITLTAMFCYESLGYYTDEPDSQPYPVPLMKWWYPDTGNFIAFVSDLSSRSLVRETIRNFREHEQFPSEGLAAPRWVPGVSFSDQWSFWEHGYKAIMITDTPILRNPHYHTQQDVPENIDFERFTRVTAGIIRTLLRAVNS